MFKDKIRKVDITASLKFALAWPIAMVVKPLCKNLWIISERPGEARDNGYALYKYIREVHPECNAYYVITKDGIDRQKVERLGNVIDYYSYRHYIYYWIASVHASAHVDAGTPNSRVSNFLETHKFLKNKKVFLQHGLIKDLLPFCFYNSTRADVFCCQAKAETEYVKKYFGYPVGNVKQTGLARFDNLLKVSVPKKQILLMPTWRAWLAKKEFKDEETARKNFILSDYFKNYEQLISDEKLVSFLETNDIELIFFVHSDMQPYWDMFTTKSNRVIVADAQKYDVQTLLMESKVLITDYSSVFFDFAYMNKPVCFFHFDYDIYRGKQHAEGYYDYKHGFGPVFDNAENLIDYLIHLSKQGYSMDKDYQIFSNDFFDLRDGKNCDRIYKVMTEL